MSAAILTPRQRILIDVAKALASGVSSIHDISRATGLSRLKVMPARRRLCHLRLSGEVLRPIVESTEPKEFGAVLVALLKAKRQEQKQRVRVARHAKIVDADLFYDRASGRWTGFALLESTNMEPSNVFVRGRTCKRLATACRSLDNATWRKAVAISRKAVAA